MLAKNSKKLMQEISDLEKRLIQKYITLSKQLDTRMDQNNNALINKVERKTESMMKEL